MTREELLAVAEFEALASSQSWDDFLATVRSKKNYNYKQAHWYTAGNALEQLKHLAPVPTPDPVPPSTQGFDGSNVLDSVIPSLGSAISVYSASDFNTKLAAAKGGDIINVMPGVVIPGEFTGFNRVVSGGTAKVVFQPGVKFTGGAGLELPAVWLKGCGGWEVMSAGDLVSISNPQGSGILAYEMPGPFKWTGFHVSNTGGTCVEVFPVNGDINNLILKGLAGTKTPILSLDPHSEKGTGLHAWNIADAKGGYVRNSSFACDVLDQATGAAVEIETDRIGENVKIWARAKNLGFGIADQGSYKWDGDAHSQVAGNIFQLWGGSIPAAGKLELMSAEADNIRGRILETNGEADSVDLSRAILYYGRALGAILQNPSLSKVAYLKKGNIQLVDCQPLP